ncbi:hypothetical protein IFM89_039311 [Coptis chinensis]|uniref:Uncharacterized protein n=1 Tax=Coptis chinensis TaxID=261450 RepID=A0A835IX36_9MAGN|nr:hypothetical protein IFM89_039311 [Coptis chinensis]
MLIYVETGGDYLDVWGEPEFMEKREVRYHKKAVAKGSLVASACGFESIQAELGLMFQCKQWVHPLVSYKVEAYLSLEPEKRIVGNFGRCGFVVLGCCQDGEVDGVEEVETQ